MTDSLQSRLTAFVNFPSPYTQELLLRALTSVLPAVSISELPPDEENPPQLQWADYDLMTFDKPHANPSRYQISSYVYRKALIRKHQLHHVILEYLAKASHRGNKSILSQPEHGGAGGVPKGWTIEVQFEDELDELLMDELYDLAETMQANEGKPEGERQWFILKPGFADRAQGIRMFSTEEEMRMIFAEYEPESDDEEDEDEEGSDDEIAERGAALQLSEAKGGDEDEEDEDEEGAVASDLRHFVIQEYLRDPLLFDLDEGSNAAPIGQKFHLRAYVLVTGGYTVHLAHTMLALFSGATYAHPSTANDEFDLRPHLTNTCLQTDAFGAPIKQEDLVRLFWDLEGSTALALRSDGGAYEPRGKVSKEWLEATFAKSGEVIAEAVRAGAECGSFGLQLMPNAFEIFGVDLMLSHPPTATTDGTLPIPDVTLLEFNASPDFNQSGANIKPLLLEMFKGVVKISIAPFFGIQVRDDEDETEEAKQEPEWQVGDERYGWRLVGKGEVRGSW